MKSLRRGRNASKLASRLQPKLTLRGLHGRRQRRHSNIRVAGLGRLDADRARSLPGLGGFHGGRLARPGMIPKKPAPDFDTGWRPVLARHAPEQIMLERMS